MSTILGFTAAGLLLGLSGGLAPGPLLALVASETLRHGVRAGVAVALAPLLTDPPIVLAALLALRPLTGQDLPLALLHLGGGLYLAWLSLESLRFRGAALPPVAPGNALRRGVIANVLNPNPYLFWLAVGAPTVLAAWRREPLAAAAFIAAFYLPLIGAKAALALLLNRLRHALLHSRGYVVLMRGLGGLLMAYALLWLYEGGRRLAMG